MPSKTLSMATIRALRGGMNGNSNSRRDKKMYRKDRPTSKNKYGEWMGKNGGRSKTFFSKFTDEFEDQESSDNKLPFMSENEEEEKIIKALSLLEEDDIDNNDDYYLYDGDYDSYDGEQEDEKEEKEGNQVLKNQHSRKQKVTSESKSKETIKKEQTTRGKGYSNATDVVADIDTQRNSMPTKKESLNVKDVSRKINQETTKDIPTTTTTTTATKFTSTLDESIHRFHSINQERKNMMSSTINKPKIPFEIPSSIDAIRARAAANSRTTSYHINPSLLNPSTTNAASTTHQIKRQNNLNPSMKATIPNSANKIPKPTASARGKVTNKKLQTTMSLTTSWARNFILSRPKDALLPIPREFLTDGFNLVQLAPIVESAVRKHEHINSSAANTPSSQTGYPSLYKAARRLILEESVNATTTTLNNINNTNNGKRPLFTAM